MRQSTKRPSSSPGAPVSLMPARQIGFAFEPGHWDGEPVIGEPAKCSQLVWTDPGSLPSDTVEYTRRDHWRHPARRHLRPQRLVTPAPRKHMHRRSAAFWAGALPEWRHYNKPAAVLVGADWYSRITGEPVRPEGGAS
jgi:hypothetical protein